MSSSQRYPASREEDAWLSDEQLGQCAPAEAEPFQSPVPTRMISNGEYMPHPQTKQQQHIEFRIKELADTATKKLGVMMFKTMAATLRKGLYVIAAIGLPALAAAQSAPDVIGPIQAALPT